jgi:hypothetical protein
MSKYNYCSAKIFLLLNWMTSLTFNIPSHLRLYHSAVWRHILLYGGHIRRDCAPSWEPEISFIGYNINSSYIRYYFENSNNLALVLHINCCGIAFRKQKFLFLTQSALSICASISTAHSCLLVCVTYIKYTHRNTFRLDIQTVCLVNRHVHTLTSISQSSTCMTYDNKRIPHALSLLEVIHSLLWSWT